MRCDESLNGAVYVPQLKDRGLGSVVWEKRLTEKTRHSIPIKSRFFIVYSSLNAL
jgi:hypothetical protein